MDWEILEYCKADMFGRGGGGGQTQGKKTVPRPEFRPAQTEYKSCMIGKKSYSRVSWVQTFAHLLIHTWTSTMPPRGRTV